MAARTKDKTRPPHFRFESFYRDRRISSKRVLSVSHEHNGTTMDYFADLRSGPELINHSTYMRLGKHLYGHDWHPTN